MKLLDAPGPVQGFILNSCHTKVPGRRATTNYNGLYVSSTARTGALCRCANGSSVLGPWVMKSKVMFETF